MQIKYIASIVAAMAISGAMADPVPAPEPVALAEPDEFVAQEWNDSYGEDWRDEYDGHDEHEGKDEHKGEEEEEKHDGRKVRARDLDVDLPEWEKRSADAFDLDRREAAADPSGIEVTDGRLARRWNDWSGRRWGRNNRNRVNYRWNNRLHTNGWDGRWDGRRNGRWNGRWNY